ncbi:MAG: MBL fold metallo-hydrolase [Treponema sp.]|jgi:Cft2 family RNA processing exonuclease|nr:MBL fold metallo-hydrolase [Treponema sp.]
MKTRIRFVALGGGQEVGASCYFLQINERNILLDCGKTPNGVYSPQFSYILKPPFLESLQQINHIFISHSHYDHVGELGYLASVCTRAGIYATPVTKALITYMLWDRGGTYARTMTDRQREYEEIQIDKAIRSIITEGYCRAIPLPGYTVTFYEAGHIPGAAMVHIQTPDRSILYTGDFSCQPSALTSPYILPDKVQFDTIIICGVHAKHPSYTSARISRQLKSIKKRLEAGYSMYLEIPQLTKAWEVLQFINEGMEKKRVPTVPVYIDRQLLVLAETMERLNIPVLKPWNYTCPNPGQGPWVWIGRKAAGSLHPCLDAQSYGKKIDFSLHPTYRELKRFILTHNPKTVVLVHTGYDDKGAANCLEAELMASAACRSQFIYAENGEIYTL